MGREQQRDEAGDDEGNQQHGRFAPPDGDRDREAGGPERGRGGDPPQRADEQHRPERHLEDRGEEEARLHGRREGVDGQDGRGRRQARVPRQVGADAVEPGRVAQVQIPCGAGEQRGQRALPGLEERPVQRAAAQDPVADRRSERADHGGRHRPENDDRRERHRRAEGLGASAGERNLEMLGRDGEEQENRQELPGRQKHPGRGDGEQGRRQEHGSPRDEPGRDGANLPRAQRHPGGGRERNLHTEYLMPGGGAALDLVASGGGRGAAYLCSTPRFDRPFDRPPHHLRGGRIP